MKNVRILIVDDEPDILECLEEALEKYDLAKATNYETAREMLESKRFDLAILDIMGVRGYDLLKIAVSRATPAIMLTAHALSADDLIESLRSGAYAYIPKDKLAEIEFFVADALEVQQGATKRSGKWMDKLKPFFTAKFGPGIMTRVKTFYI